MTLATRNNYWISPHALSIQANAMGNSEYVQCSVASGSMIMCYMKGVDDLDFDNGHNYRRWPLQASPTLFNTTTKKYIYIAIPRKNTNIEYAQVVFPPVLIDIDGCDAEGNIVGSDKYLYIYLGAYFTEPAYDAKKQQTVRFIVGTIDTGILATDEAIASRKDEWYEYNDVDESVTFLKEIVMKAESFFRNLNARIINVISSGSIEFADRGKITGVANDNTAEDDETRVTSAEYVSKHYISKVHSDTATGEKYTFTGNVDVFGNLVIDTKLTVKGSSELKGDVQVGTLDNHAKLNVLGETDFGTYNKGIEGGHVDFYGNAEFESIVARTFLEVPELRKSRTTITVGNRWQTVGAGLIESVTPYDEYTGKATLKLEKGEPGAIAVDDLCQGVFSFGIDDSTETSDPHNGNFLFKGFTTVYFKVTKLLKDDASEFEYELRAKTCRDLPVTDRNRWTNATHPALGMHFAAYANPTNKDRQASRLTTTTYQIHLVGMTDWTYTQDNIQVILGWLEGFTLMRKVWDPATRSFVIQPKPLKGEGIAVGNIYMWGNVNQFDRAPSLVSQQLYYKATDAASSTPVPDASASGLTPPEGILISTNHDQYNLNGWQPDPITPSPVNRYVWQQWLYAYADGTYDVSTPSLNAIDPTVCMAYVDKPVISLGISDWYDPQNPDNVEFDITAHLTVGGEITPISSVTAEYEGELCDLMTYDVTYDESHLHATVHVILHGFIGTQVNGITPDDAFLTLHLVSAAPVSDAVHGSGSPASDGSLVGAYSADAIVTLAQNRQGEDGEPGKGYRGAKPLMYKWSDIKSDPTITVYSGDADDEEFYSIILDDTDLSGDTQYYTPRITHLITEGESLSNTDLWRKANKMSFTATDLFFAKRAYINNLGVNNVLLTDGTEQGTYGGMCLPDPNDKAQRDSLGDIRLWLGGNDPKTAPFSVNDMGEVKTTLLRLDMDFRDYKVYRAGTDDYPISSYMKIYCPSFMRMSLTVPNDSHRRVDDVDINGNSVSSTGYYDQVITKLRREPPMKFIVLPYAGDVLGKEIKIIVPNSFHKAAYRGVIAISALTGSSQTPVKMMEYENQWDYPFPGKVPSGYYGLDPAVPTGYDGYFYTMNGDDRSMIYMDTIPDDWMTKNGRPRSCDDDEGLPEEDKYDRISYLHLFAAKRLVMSQGGIDVYKPVWYIIDSKNVLTIGTNTSISYDDLPIA